MEVAAFLAKRGYPTLKTGYYCREPVFGDLIREALRLGYMPVGYSHARKVPQVSERGGKKVETTWMAARFKKSTGIDPLTVDQTTVMEHASAAREHPAYRLAVEKKKVSDRPVVLFDAKAERYYVPPADRGAFDMVVFHPRDMERDGRPTWLRMGGYRKEVKVAGLPVAPKEGSLLAQAFVKGEDADAIGVDQVEYGSGESGPLLLLPKGAYMVRVVDATGKTVHEGGTKVE